MKRAAQTPPPSDGQIEEAARRKPSEGVTGGALIEAMQKLPYREIEIEPRRERVPMRDVEL